MKPQNIEIALSVLMAWGLCSGCTRPTTPLHEALTQSPDAATVAGVTALTPQNAAASILAQAQRPGFAKAGKNYEVAETGRSPASLADTSGDGEGSSPQALGKLADKLTQSMKKVNWIEAPADGPSHTDDDSADTTAELAQAGPTVCTSVEYAGIGMDATEKDKTLRNPMKTAFTDVKENLLGWLALNRRRFPEATYAFLESQIKTARLQNTAADADLEWRGIGVWTRDTVSGDPLIKLGSGFYTLMKKQPARAKFELARLLAQTWAPCELEKRKLAQPWNTYLRCMGFNGPSLAPGQGAVAATPAAASDDEALGCAPGGYSEAGWAVSSAVATSVADPGCRIPAFNEPTHAECPKSFLLPLMLGAENEVRPVLKTKEARR